MKFFPLLFVALTLVASSNVRAETAPREIQIIVEAGYTPRLIDIAPGEAVRLKIIRKEYTPCTKEIVFPSLEVKRELPVGEPVFIDIPPQQSGEVPFRCGMNMFKGSLVVKAGA